jgi:hypothetical protein
MTVNSVLLNVTQDRLHFWQFQLQAAFRDGDRERAATCEHIVAEYGRLIAEYMKHLRGSKQAGELAAPTRIESRQHWTPCRKLVHGASGLTDMAGRKH